MHGCFCFSDEPDPATAGITRFDFLHGFPEEVLFANRPTIWVSQDDEHARAKLFPVFPTFDNVVFKVSFGVAKDVCEKVGVDPRKWHSRWQGYELFRI